jgi:phosphoglycolate phosphatase
MPGTAIKGLLFDKDGTLLDFHATWLPAYRSAAHMVAREALRPATGEDLLALGGYDHGADRFDPGSLLACGTTAEIARLWASEAGLDDVVRLEAGLEAIFHREAAARAVPVTGLFPLFQRLAGRGLVLGIATMDSERLARTTADSFGIDSFLSFVCGYDSGFGQKPDAGMVEAFCRSTGLDAASIAVIGDTPHDLHMGRAAGAGLVVGVLSGASAREALEAHCDQVLDNVLGLESIIG